MILEVSSVRTLETWSKKFYLACSSCFPLLYGHSGEPRKYECLHFSSVPVFSCLLLHVTKMRYQSFVSCTSSCNLCFGTSFSLLVVDHTRLAES